jgi:osmoprotectant transport system ATP-binding protein
VIEFQSVSKTYPDGTTAVDDLSLVIPDGSITVFVGPSGCGKTTSLRMINRLIEPTGGRILVNDEDASRQDMVRLRRSIGYVIQNGGLFPHRTVLDNIATVPVLLGWDRKKARQRAAELLERVGLSAHLGSRYPRQLSGGQQQRVGVARALAADPPIMLMDEPFSAVDPVVRADLQDEFLRLQQELGKTIVFVSHDIEEAIRLGDQIAVLREGGRLAQFGAPQELLEEPADDFVADFIGRDRGIRTLSFLSSHGLPVEHLPHAPADDLAAVVRAGATAPSGWVLLVDGSSRPTGWQRMRDGEPGETLPRSATFTPDAPVRVALDAAVLSPTGTAVCVDADGRLLGGTTHEQIARGLANRQPAEAVS